jgi:hypothetical protein
MLAPADVEALAAARPVDAEGAVLLREGAVLDGVGRQFVRRHAEDLGGLVVEPEGRAV